MYAREQFKWVKIRETHGHSGQVDMYASFCCRVLFWESRSGIDCVPLTSQCCTSPRASAGCQRSAPMTWAKTWDMTTCWDFYPMQLLKEATWRRICLHLLSRWMYWLICESSRWPNDRVGVVFIFAVFNDTVVKILAHDKGCETKLSLLDS